jgi:hypothetical protein
LHYKCEQRGMIGVDPINGTGYVFKSIGEYHALAIADKDGTVNTRM